jgi:hypothetical protein
MKYTLRAAIVAVAAVVGGAAVIAAAVAAGVPAVDAPASTAGIGAAVVVGIFARIVRVSGRHISVNGAIASLNKHVNIVFRGWRTREGPAGIRPEPQTAPRIDRLVSYLLDSAVQQLPDGLWDRWAEEWAEHRTQRRGWRLVWWALCLRAVASRTGQEYRRAQLPNSNSV